MGLGQSGCSAGAGGVRKESGGRGGGSPGCPWRCTGYHGEVVRAHGWAADPLVQGQAPGAVGVIGFPSSPWKSFQDVKAKWWQRLWDPVSVSPDPWFSAPAGVYSQAWGCGWGWRGWASEVGRGKGGSQTWRLWGPNWQGNPGWPGSSINR